jgi:hypothetical protein
MYLDGLALERSHQFGCLIRSNSTGDADDDSHISIVVQRTVNRDQVSGIRKVGRENTFPTSGTAQNYRLTQDGLTEP